MQKTRNLKLARLRAQKKYLAERANLPCRINFGSTEFPDFSLLEQGSIVTFQKSLNDI